MFPTLKRVKTGKKIQSLTKWELIDARESLVKDFGFTKNEILYVASRKPDLLLYTTSMEDMSVGMRVLKEFFIEQK